MDNNNFETLDAFIDRLKEKSKERRLYLINNEKMQEFRDSCNGLESIIKETSPDAKIEYETNAMNAGIGIMRIETDELVVHDIKQFIESISLATNFEVYPLTNGNIKIGITFYDIAEEIKK